MGASRLVAVVFVAASFAFLARRLGPGWRVLRHTVPEAAPAPLLGGVVAAAGAMVTIALGWTFLLGRAASADPVTGSGPEQRWRRPVRVQAWYFAGEIGKYVPGGIWPVLGRAELARRGGVDRRVAYGSVIGSLLLLYGVATVLLAAAPPESLQDRLLLRVGRWVVLAVLVGSAVLVAGSGRARRWLARRLRRLRVLPGDEHDGRRVVVASLCYVLAWSAIGLAAWLVATSLFDGAELWPVARATVASWWLGFVVLPVPGGVGVREAAFVLADPRLPADEAVALAALMRVIHILVDAVGAVVALAVLRRLDAQRPPTPAVDHPSR